VTTTIEAFVDQQGVDHYRSLLKQRTRWYQGHLSSITRLPGLWGSDRIGQTALVEVTSYLLVPWLIVLPWSILQQWVFLRLFFAGGSSVLAHDVHSPEQVLIYAALFYLLSFLPNLVIGLVYARRTSAVSIGRALVLGHLMILWNFIGYVAVWRALLRMVRGRRAWDKTPRAREEPPFEALRDESPAVAAR
jgi:hypothetical protein